MKTLSTIFISGTIISSIMVMGNKDEYNFLQHENESYQSELENTDPEEDIFNPELEIDYDQLFLMEEVKELTLDEIEFIEIHEENF